MKYHLLLFLFFGLFFSCKSIKESLESDDKPSPTILLVATAHDLRETAPKVIEEVKEEIIQFQPEVFFVELPPADDKYANEVVFKYSQNFDLFHHLLNKKNIHIRMADSVIAEYQQQLKDDPDNPEYLGNLLHAYLLKFDIANALYQSYLLFSQYQSNDSAMAILDSTLFSTDTLDQYQLIITGNEKDEFSQIVFPTAQALGLDLMYGFDNRDDEYAYNHALRNNDQELKKYVMDSLGIQEDEAIKNKLEELLGTNKRRLKDHSQLFTFLNSETYDQYREIEYTQRLALTPSESSENYLKYWKLRNQKMSNNVIQVMQKTKANKAVILVGAGHAWILSHILKDKGYQVIRPFREVRVEEK